MISEPTVNEFESWNNIASQTMHETQKTHRHSFLHQNGRLAVKWPATICLPENGFRLSQHSSAYATYASGFIAGHAVVMLCVYTTGKYMLSSFEPLKNNTF